MRSPLGANDDTHSFYAGFDDEPNSIAYWAGAGRWNYRGVNHLDDFGDAEGQHMAMC